MFERIGIIGDVHAHHQHLELALNHLSRLGVDLVLCTGDIMDGVGDVDACVQLLQGHAARTVRGNHDRWVLEDKAPHVPNAHQRSDLSDPVVEYLQQLPRQIEIDTPLGKLLLCHGVANNDLQKIWPGTERMPVERSSILDELIAKQQHALMVNGHMHYRTLIHFQDLTLLNAGTVRGDHRPGFSMLNLADGTVQGFEIFAKAEQKVRMVKTLSLACDNTTRTFRDTQHFDGTWDPVTLYA